ncbi:MAG: hypothetical protein D6730_06495 [Bacteroidetes bacterium]|nr:MAG: hypothetical protein D6730_06495 [Bacteroidota bacterium]
MRIILTSVLACFVIVAFAQSSSSTIVASNAAELSSKKREVAAQKPDSKLDSLKTAYLRMVQEHPGYVPALDQLAGLYRSMGQLDSAIFYYQRSLELQPGGIIARQSLAAAYLVQEDYPTAISHYQQLIRQHPDYPEAYQGLARVYLAQKAYEKAIQNSEIALRWYLIAKKHEHAADARMLAGQAYMGIRDYKRAIKYFKASKKHFKDKAFYHYYIGYSYLRLNKEKEAMTYLRTAQNMGYQLPTYVKARLTD